MHNYFYLKKTKASSVNLTLMTRMYKIELINKFKLVFSVYKLDFFIHRKNCGLFEIR